MNAGYIRTSQIDHNLTATASYKVSPAWSGTVTLGQNLNSQRLQSRQTLGAGLIAPQPFNLANTAAAAAALRLPADGPAGVVLRAGDGRSWEPALPSRRRVRNDGASTFGADQPAELVPQGERRLDVLPGRGEGNRWLTFGKLRAAYGQSGTQPQPYLLPALFNADDLADGGWGPASSTQIGGVGGLVTRYNLPTTNLGPERVKEFEAGLDLGLFKDKADFGVTYYRQNSTGVILNIPVAGSTGYTEEPANAASLRNYRLGARAQRPADHTRDFAWEVGAQWAHNRSLVTDLAGVQFAPFPLSGGSNGLRRAGRGRSRASGSASTTAATTCAAAAA